MESNTEDVDLEIENKEPYEFYPRISEEVTNKELALFTGGSSYLFAWSGSGLDAESHRRIKKQNYGAIFPLPWFLYRKMYIHFFAFVTVILCFELLWSVVPIRFDIMDRVAGLGSFVYFLFENRDFGGSLDICVGIGLVILTSYGGNTWYLKHAIKKIKAIKDLCLNEDETERRIIRAGGTSSLGVLVGCLYVVMVGYLWYQLVYLAFDSGFQEKAIAETEKVLQLPQGVGIEHINITNTRRLSDQGFYPAQVTLTNQDKIGVNITLYFRKLEVQVRTSSTHPSFLQEVAQNFLQTLDKYKNKRCTQIRVLKRDKPEVNMRIAAYLENGDHVQLIFTKKSYRNYDIKLDKHVQGERSKFNTLTKAVLQNVNEFIQGRSEYKNCICEHVEVAKKLKSRYYMRAFLSNGHVAVVDVKAANIHVLKFFANEDEASTFIDIHATIAYLQAQPSSKVGLYLAVLEMPLADGRAVAETMPMTITQVLQGKIDNSISCTRFEITKENENIYIGIGHLNIEKRVKVEVTTSEKRTMVNIKEFLD